MIAGDLKSYINYFKAWSDDHPDTKFFFFGSIEKGIEFARSLPEFDYPFVWLEQPVIISGDNGASHLLDHYHTAISVMIQAPGDDQEKQIDSYALALEILDDLHAKLRADNHDALIHFDTNSLKKESVLQLWADNHYGFRMELTLDLTANSPRFARKRR